MLNGVSWKNLSDPAGLVRVWTMKRAGHCEGTGGTSLNISSHNSRHSLQIRVSPADAMAVI